MLILENQKAEHYLALVRLYAKANRRLLAQMARSVWMYTKTIIGNIWYMMKNLYWMIHALLRET